jgi:hypothetical protein
MEYVLSIILTLIAAFTFIVIVRIKGKASIKNILFSQSQIHMLLKDVRVEEKEKEKVSQLQKHLSKNAIKVMAIEDKAYWVANNIFYSADLIDNMPDFLNAQPIDTENMSQEELDKLMFVLDNLRRGLEDDSSSSGN